MNIIKIFYEKPKFLEFLKTWENLHHGEGLQTMDVWIYWESEKKIHRMR